MVDWYGVNLYHSKFDFNDQNRYDIIMQHMLTYEVRWEIVNI